MTQGVAKFVQPNFLDPNQDMVSYKTAIDNSIYVMARMAASFAVYENNPQDMSVIINSGAVVTSNNVNEVPTQTISISPAPINGTSRIDRIVLNKTGIASVVTGTPSSSPVPPDILNTYLPLARIHISSNQNEITNADISDERCLLTVSSFINVSILNDDGKVPVNLGGTNISSYNIGDILYASATNVLTKLPKGTAGQVLIMNSGATAPQWGSIVIPKLHHQEFKSSGTFTTSANITTSTIFKFVLTGGGGGTGGIGVGPGGSGITGGGGSGATAIFYTTGLTPNTSYTITVGSGGTAGSSMPTSGGIGGSTSITINGVTVTASGGYGSDTGVGSGGNGGTSTNGTINISGSIGTSGVSSTGGLGGPSIYGNTSYGSGGNGQYLSNPGGYNAIYIAGTTGKSGFVTIEWME